jgi:hypothetical protein
MQKSCDKRPYPSRGGNDINDPRAEGGRLWKAQEASGQNMRPDRVKMDLGRSAQGPWAN